MKKSRKIFITKCVLTAIGIAGLITIVAIAPNSLQMLQLFGLGRKKYKPRSVYSTLKRLEREKIIEIHERGDRAIMTITEKGKKRLLKYNIDDIEIKIPKKWDGKWRIVSFDIPEKQKKAREALRHKLKELDFLPLQKSLFIFPYPCKNEIDFVTRIFQVESYVIFLETKIIDGEYKPKKYFGL
jgi:DNA-binding transcriptional regulator PaaX